MRTRGYNQSSGLHVAWWLLVPLSDPIPGNWGRLVENLEPGMAARWPDFVRTSLYYSLFRNRIRR